MFARLQRQRKRAREQSEPTRGMVISGAGTNGERNRCQKTVPAILKNRGDWEAILGSDSNCLATDSLGAEPGVWLPSR